MQIRLTVLAPRSGHASGRACDVLVTAPAGTALAAVASGLATAASGPDASGAVVLYAGGERLGAPRCALGEPPLIDGAVLSLQVPGPVDAPPEDVPARLHVVAGPDAGGVHLLHGGQIRVGRSAEADVPLDDPDVSRLHCAVTVSENGRISVADLGSTNGTTLEGVEVGPLPVPLAPGALLRLGESTLRVMAGERTAALPTAPDGEGHLRITRAGVSDAGAPADAGRTDAGRATTGQAPGTSGYGAAPAARHYDERDERDGRGERDGRHQYDPYGTGRPPVPGTPRPRTAPDAQDPSARTHGRGTPAAYGADQAYGGRAGTPLVPEPRGAAESPYDTTAHSRAAAPDPVDGAQPHDGGAGSRRQGTPMRGTPRPDASAARRGGIGAWARRL
ncbi:hypothetical protein QR77_13205, partial [Streptomyces sp. 150FB]|uniref:FHA domain-containing protein n=1 Tax=Streptomyces sp. 150FB TaxID=1576605 RepID=UPI000588EE1F